MDGVEIKHLDTLCTGLFLMMSTFVKFPFVETDDKEKVHSLILELANLDYGVASTDPDPDPDDGSYDKYLDATSVLHTKFTEVAKKYVEQGRIIMPNGEDSPIYDKDGNYHGSTGDDYSPIVVRENGDIYNRYGVFCGNMNVVAEPPAPVEVDEPF